VHQSKEVLKQWITAVNDEGRKLTDWEVQFMESITEQFDNSGSQDARDIMLECGFPVANDFRTIGTTPWAGHIRRFIMREE